MSERLPPQQPGGAADSVSGDLVRLPETDTAGRASFVHGGRVYAVFTVDGATVVTDGVCPHKGGPLAEGTVRDGSVVCPWHWYAFDLATGECRNAHEVTLRRHEVVDVDGVPHARLTVPAVLSWAERLRAHARGES